MEALMGKLLPLWINARGLQFSWEFIQMGLATNIRMVCHCHLRAPHPRSDPSEALPRGRV